MGLFEKCETWTLMLLSRCAVPHAPAGSLELGFLLARQAKLFCGFSPSLLVAVSISHWLNCRARPEAVNTPVLFDQALVPKLKSDMFCLLLVFDD